MGVRVAVAGASGYAGGELLRLIDHHPGLELGPVTADSSAGTAVAELHPQLASLGGRVIEPTDPGLLAAADLIFLALPHEQSAVVATRLPADAAVVDLSASFRLADPAAWAAFYAGEHAGTWTYGLPELPGARREIRESSRVAVPGCHATAAILALAPLLASGIAGPQDIVITSASGTSGAGRSPARHLLATEIMGSLSAYQVGGVHRHTPEIEQALAACAATRPVISFTPLLVPMPRGILATCTARLASGATSEDARQALAEAYPDEPFVQVLPAGQWPSTGATAGSNAIQLQAAVDAHAGRAVVIAAIDNLGKGAAGQAVQAANIMLGLPETAGLTAHGVAP